MVQERLLANFQSMKVFLFIRKRKFVTPYQTKNNTFTFLKIFIYKTSRNILDLLLHRNMDIYFRAPAMDIRRQTAHELTSGATNVPDGRSSGHHNRVSAAAINHKIGRTSVTPGSAAIDSLTALAARNDMAVGLNQNVPSMTRPSNSHSVSFSQNPPATIPSGYSSTGNSGMGGNMVLQVPSGPSSLIGNNVDSGILDISGGVVEPLDYEEYVQQQQRNYGNATDRISTSGNSRGNIAATGYTAEERLHLIDFPADDIEVNVVPRKIRTVQHVVPQEPL